MSSDATSKKCVQLTSCQQHSCSTYRNSLGKQLNTRMVQLRYVRTLSVSFSLDSISFFYSWWLLVWTTVSFWFIQMFVFRVACYPWHLNCSVLRKYMWAVGELYLMSVPLVIKDTLWTAFQLSSCKSIIKTLIFHDQINGQGRKRFFSQRTILIESSMEENPWRRISYIPTAGAQ